MPIVNGNASFSVGRDCQLVLMGPFGRVDLPNVTGFQARQMTAPVKVDRLDGVQLHAELPKGWEGTFDLERGNSAVDDLFAQAEDAWLTTGTYNVATIYQYITESDGSTSTYQYDNVALKGDPGAWRGDSAVKQSISFSANRRRRI